MDFIHSQGPLRDLPGQQVWCDQEGLCVSEHLGTAGYEAPIFPFYARVIPSLRQSPKTSRQCHPGALLEPSPAQQFEAAPESETAGEVRGFTWTTVAAGHPGSNHRWAGRCGPRILGESPVVPATGGRDPAAARGSGGCFGQLHPLVSTHACTSGHMHACVSGPTDVPGLGPQEAEDRRG